MYICVCKAVSHNTISKLLEKKSKDEIVKSTGITNDCGECKKAFEAFCKDRTLV